MEEATTSMILRCSCHINGIITSMNVIKSTPLLKTKETTRDLILLTFGEGKASIVGYNPETCQINTIQLYNFEEKVTPGIFHYIIVNYK